MNSLMKRNDNDSIFVTYIILKLSVMKYDYREKFFKSVAITSLAQYIRRVDILKS